MWSAATCHCRERHHDARIGLRTAAPSTDSAARNPSLASASGPLGTGGDDACAMSPPPPISFSRRGLSPRRSPLGLLPSYRVNLSFPRTVSTLHPPCETAHAVSA